MKVELICVFIRTDKRELASPLLCSLHRARAQKKRVLCKPERGFSPGIHFTGTLISNLWPSNLEEINDCCLSHTVYGWLLRQPVLTKTEPFQDVEKKLVVHMFGPVYLISQWGCVLWQDKESSSP